MRRESNVPKITKHALERYLEHWKPQGTPEQVRAELIALATDAAPTKQKTLLGDAFVWRAARADGQIIPLAVRRHPRGDLIVVTVLRPGAYEDSTVHMGVDLDLDRELLEQREADLAYMHAMTRANREKTQTEASVAERDKERQQKIDNAKNVIRRHTSGEFIHKHKVLSRACEVLGLNIEDVEAQQVANKKKRFVVQEKLGIEKAKSGKTNES
jgi:hypothetical protein